MCAARFTFFFCVSFFSLGLLKQRNKHRRYCKFSWYQQNFLQISQSKWCLKNYLKLSLEKKRLSLSFKPGIWYFSHALGKLTSQNKIWGFYKKFLCDMIWELLLVYWAFSNKSRVTPCVTSPTFSSRDNFCV